MFKKLNRKDENLFPNLSSLASINLSPRTLVRQDFDDMQCNDDQKDCVLG